MQYSYNICCPITNKAHFSLSRSHRNGFGEAGLSFCGFLKKIYNIRIGHRDNNGAKASRFSIKKNIYIYRLVNSGVATSHPTRLTTMYIYSVQIAYVTGSRECVRRSAAMKKIARCTDTRWVWNWKVGAA